VYYDISEEEDSQSWWKTFIMAVVFHRKIFIE
jgi:hypothetical protein